MDSWSAFWYSTPGPPVGFPTAAGLVATKWVVSIWILSEARPFMTDSAARASSSSVDGSHRPKQTETPDVSAIVCVWTLTTGEV